MDIPLFPLNTVLFPGGVLPLRIFEQRYLDMAAACMKEERPFGICLIAAGEEVGGVAEPHPVGTLARIVDWEMEQLGLLQVTTRGEQRFRIVDKEAGPDKLWRARVEVIANDGPLPFPLNVSACCRCCGGSPATSAPPAFPSRTTTTMPSGSVTASPRSCRCRTWPSRSCWSSKTRFPASKSSRSFSTSASCWIET
jgi:hypothetical protein